MKTLFIDGFAGVSGDMLLGALIDAGADADDIRNRLRTMPLTGYSLTTAKVIKNGISATKVYIDSEETGQHRHLQDILNLLDNSGLPGRVRERSAGVFRSLAVAEAKVHNMPVERVHFHEVGSVDSIIDIVGSVLALELLGVEEDIICSPLPLGSGFVRCAHGILPLPAPATVELLTGVPVIPSSVSGETVTPTGAALVKTLSREFGRQPPMVIEGTGYGAGTAEREIPNVLRVMLGTATERSYSKQDFLWVVETNIDDMNPEFFPYIMEMCLSAGAADIYVTPVLMKKGRPGHLLSALCPEEPLEAVAGILLRESSSLGVRCYPVNRRKLLRDIVPVDTRYGVINIKVGRHPDTGAVLNLAPEWEDCREAAQAGNIPVKTVYDAAKTAAWQKITP